MRIATIQSGKEWDAARLTAWKRLKQQLLRIVHSVQGRMGVCVYDLRHEGYIGIHAQEFFPMASVCKTPILVAAYREAEAGRLDLNRRLTFTAEARTPGSGLFNYFDVGIEPTVRDLLLMMIVVSDNAATDLVLNELGGPAAVTKIMADIGLPSIHLNRTIRQLIGDIHIAIEPTTAGLSMEALDERLLTDDALATRFRDPQVVREAVNRATAEKDVATPDAIASLYGMIANHTCATPASCQSILQTLERQQLRTRLPRELPPGVKVQHKTGSLGIGTVANDTGLLTINDHTVAVAVLSRDVSQPPALTNTAIARVGRAVYDHYAALE